MITGKPVYHKGGKMFPNRWTKGASYRKYSYTIKDIARVAGRSIGTVRNDMCSGKLDAYDLESVVKYVKARTK
jgi:hypothetical protein